MKLSPRESRKSDVHLPCLLLYGWLLPPLPLWLFKRRGGCFGIFFFGGGGGGGGVGGLCLDLGKFFFFFFFEYFRVVECWLDLGCHWDSFGIFIVDLSTWTLWNDLGFQRIFLGFVGILPIFGGFGLGWWIIGLTWDVSGILLGFLWDSFWFWWIGTGLDDFRAIFWSICSGFF